MKPQTNDFNFDIYILNYQYSSSSSLLFIVQPVKQEYPCKYTYQNVHTMYMWFGPRQANLVLIAYASSEGQASLRIRAVSPEPSLLAHTSSESRGTFREKARSLAPLNGWACAVKICHDGMLEDTNSLDGAHLTASLIGDKYQIRLTRSK